jgi:hypothetical protein
MMVDSGMTAMRLSRETDVVMSDADWLAKVFEEAEREYRALPEWARPVVTPPAAYAGDDAVGTEAPTDAPRGTEVQP